MIGKLASLAVILGVVSAAGTAASQPMVHGQAPSVFACLSDHALRHRCAPERLDREHGDLVGIWAAGDWLGDLRSARRP